MTWKDGQAVLLREYKKKKNQLRREQQEYPKISFGEAKKNSLIPLKLMKGMKNQKTHKKRTKRCK